MTEFKFFKSSQTGKTGYFPASFADRPGFVEVDPSGCEDCLVMDEPALDLVTTEVYEIKDSE